MVQRPAGQVDDLRPRCGDLRLPFDIRKAPQRVGRRDIEIVADERHAEWRIDARDEYRSRFGDAVAIGVAQQRDAIRARAARAGALHQSLHDPALDAFAVFGLRRCCRFGDEHVAVRQHVDPARVLELHRERLDRGAGGRDRRGAVGPALGRRDLNSRHQRLGRRGQGRVRTDPCRFGKLGSLAASAERHRACQRRGEDGEGSGVHQRAPQSLPSERLACEEPRCCRRRPRPHVGRGRPAEALENDATRRRGRNVRRPRVRRRPSSAAAATRYAASAP